MKKKADTGKLPAGLLVKFSVIMSCAVPLYAAEFAVTPFCGINAAGISSDHDDDALGRKAGVRAGLDFSVTLTKWVGLKTGAAFSSKGAAWRYERENDDGDAVDAVDVSHARYCDIPLSAMVTFPEAGLFRPFLSAGVEGSLFLGAYKVVRIDGKEIYRESKNEDARNTDFGIKATGGVTLAAGPGDLVLEGGYVFGVLEVNRNEEESVKNSVALFTLGYRMFIGGRR